MPTHDPFIPWDRDAQFIPTYNDFLWVKGFYQMPNRVELVTQWKDLAELVTIAFILDCIEDRGMTHE